jgi:nitric oxide reductase large subunit
MRRYVWLWTGLFVVIAASFAVLGYFGREIYRQAPPVPERVVTSDGRVLFTGQDIRNGQNVWQSFGGQQVGSIWGHGAYVAPDWSAGWLHREAMWLLDRWATDNYGKAYTQLDEETQAALQAVLQREIRTNTYQPETGDLVVSPLRAVKTPRCRPSPARTRRVQARQRQSRRCLTRRRSPAGTRPWPVLQSRAGSLQVLSEVPTPGVP